MPVNKVDPESIEAVELKHAGKHVALQVTHIIMWYLSPLIIAVTALCGVQIDYTLDLQTHNTEIVARSAKGAYFSPASVTVKTETNADLSAVHVSFAKPILKGNATVTKIRVVIKETWYSDRQRYEAVASPYELTPPLVPSEDEYSWSIPATAFPKGKVTLGHQYLFKFLYDVEQTVTDTDGVESTVPDQLKLNADAWWKAVVNQ